MSARQLRRAASRRRTTGARRAGRLVLAGGASAGALLAFASGAEATEFTVSNTLDSGPGSLRKAIADANSAPGVDDDIVFTPAARGTIHLTSGEIDVDHGVAVYGPGAEKLTVSGDDASRIFDVSTGFGETFAVYGLHLTQGYGAAGQGGAIFSSGPSKMRLYQVVIDDSKSLDLGGAVYDVFGLLVIQESTISGNQAVSGGGVASYAGTARIEQSTISGNEAEEAGAGLALAFGSSKIENSTISGNTGNTGGGGSSAVGGGVLSYAGHEMTIESSTISGNASPGSSGGGVASVGDSEGPILHNSIVSENHAAVGPDLYTYSSGWNPFHATYSLIGTTAGAQVEQPIPGSNVIGEDPNLLPLADNGGNSINNPKTFALGDGSPAIDAGDPADFPRMDERWVPRPQSFAPDMGAFEVEDTKAPNARITSRPDRRIVTTNRQRKVKLSFSAKEPGTTFECKLKGGTKPERHYRPCHSPRPYLLEARRGEGKRYAFSVRATDATGNVDPTPAKARFRIIRRG